MILVTQIPMQYKYKPVSVFLLYRNYCEHRRVRRLADAAAELADSAHYEDLSISLHHYKTPVPPEHECSVHLMGHVFRPDFTSNPDLISQATHP